MPEVEATYTVKELIARVEGKIDIYTAQMNARVDRLEDRMISAEANQKYYIPRFEQVERDATEMKHDFILFKRGAYVWGLMALFGGSALGQVLSHYLDTL